MCLNILSGPHKAAQAIPVYKNIHRDDRSMYQRFRYKPNQFYSLGKKLKLGKNLVGSTIHRGFHSYEQRAHAVKLRRSQYRGSTCKTVLFWIPKGAIFYKGMRGDLVSTSIRSGELIPGGSR